MLTVCFATLGCKVNQVDTAYLNQSFTTRGYRVVPWPGPADVCVINTCTVTATADRQSRQMVHRARRFNPDSIVVVTGCGPISGGGTPNAFDDADLVTGNVEKQDLIRLVDEARGAGPLRCVADVASVETVQAGGAYDLPGRTRAFLKVQDGCPAACTYCIVPVVRGPSRSVAPDVVIGAVRELVAAGRNEVVLTGIHLGLYGHDLQPASRLTALCERILRETDLLRLRLSSIEPREVTADLLHLMAGEPRLCPHLHIPLQSGCDRILRAMNRPYDTALFADAVARCRQEVDNITIGADVLTGFPGESEEDFGETFAFLDRLRLPHLHVFPSSDRPGTPASTMPDRVNRREARDRAKRLRDAARGYRHEFMELQVGRVLPVLIERSETGFSEGLSRNYLPVAVQEVAHGEVPVEITAVDVERLRLTGRGRE